MAPSSSSSNPPERHFGYVCSKCQTSSFVGRRYACWVCIGYQLCGTCYDSGQLPVTPEHKYFHPLETHYTRAEYELYFGGESYVEANVPQSYKCAFCDLCGFTNKQLYKHLYDTHQGHKDFYDYFSILYTRYLADSSMAPGTGADIGTGTGTDTDTDAGSGPIVRIDAGAGAGPESGGDAGAGIGSSTGSGPRTATGPRSTLTSGSVAGACTRGTVSPAVSILWTGPRHGHPFGPASHRSEADTSAISFREAVRINQARRIALLNEQTITVLREMRMSAGNRRMHSGQCLGSLNRNTLLDASDQQQPHQQQPPLLQQLAQSLYQYQNQQPGYVDPRAIRNPKTSRVRGMPPGMRQVTVFPKPNTHSPRNPTQEDWVSYLGISSNRMEQQNNQHQQHHNRASYADILREVPAFSRGQERQKERERGKEDKNKDKCRDMDKTNCDKSDSHKFLCRRYLDNELQGRPQHQLKKKSQQPQKSDPYRRLFVEAIMCSMLTLEELQHVSLQPMSMKNMLAECPDYVPSAKARTKSYWDPVAEEISISSCYSSDHGLNTTDDVMDRFYSGLDTYHKWLTDFMTKKSKGNHKDAAVPDLVLQATHEPVEGADFEGDPDTDERDDEYEVQSMEVTYKALRTHIPTIGTIAEVSEELEEEAGDEDIYVDADEDVDVDVDVEADVDVDAVGIGESEGESENVEDEYEEDYGETSGTETSESTRAILVDQFHGYESST